MEVGLTSTRAVIRVQGLFLSVVKVQILKYSIEGAIIQGRVPL